MGDIPAAPVKYAWACANWDWFPGTSRWLRSFIRMNNNEVCIVVMSSAFCFNLPQNIIIHWFVLIWHSSHCIITAWFKCRDDWWRPPCARYIRKDGGVWILHKLVLWSHEGSFCKVETTEWTLLNASFDYQLHRNPISCYMDVSD